MTLIRWYMMHTSRMIKNIHRLRYFSTLMKSHWEKVYTTKQENQLSWFQNTPHISLQLIKRATMDLQKTHKLPLRILDIGGGTSSLVDHLLKDENLYKIAILDISQTSLQKSQTRLGEQLAKKVEWIVHDATTFTRKSKFDICHDRAVFHFLVNEKDRDNYVKNVYENLSEDGQLVIATFSFPDGPLKCSGLDVQRYSAEMLQEVFEKKFVLLESTKEKHITPQAKEQNFVYCRFKKI